MKEIPCCNSFFLFSRENKLRRSLFLIINNEKYKTLIVLLILLNCIGVIMETYVDNADVHGSSTSNLKDIIFGIKYFSSVGFVIDLAFKCIVVGVVLDKESYLRKLWNQLEFFITVAIVLDVFLDDNSEIFGINSWEVFYKV